MKSKSRHFIHQAKCLNLLAKFGEEPGAACEWAMFPETPGMNDCFLSLCRARVERLLAPGMTLFRVGFTHSRTDYINDTRLVTTNEEDLPDFIEGLCAVKTLHSGLHTISAEEREGKKPRSPARFGFPFKWCIQIPLSVLDSGVCWLWYNRDPRAWGGGGGGGSERLVWWSWSFCPRYKQSYLKCCSGKSN